MEFYCYDINGCCAGAADDSGSADGDLCGGSTPLTDLGKYFRRAS